MQEYDIDGVYLDGTSEPWGCRNAHHGCGYLKPDGTFHMARSAKMGAGDDDSDGDADDGDDGAQNAAIRGTFLVNDHRQRDDHYRVG